MAIGTITRAVKAGAAPSASVYFDRLSFVGDASYPTGGMAFKSLFQAVTKDQREPLVVTQDDCGGYLIAYDPTTGKIKVYRGDNANGAAAPAVEVSNAVDLSGVTFNVVVISQ